jgi:hypothetical protein
MLQKQAFVMPDRQMNYCVVYTKTAKCAFNIELGMGWNENMSIKTPFSLWTLST